MAVNYATLFANLGEFVQRINQFTSLYTSLDTYLDEIEADLGSAGRYDVLSGLPEEFDGFKSVVQGWCYTMVSKTTQLLTHRDDVLEQLNLGNNTSIQTVLYNIIRDMNDNSQTIDASTVTIGSVTSDKVNSDAGTVVTGKVLDGYSNPGDNLAANPEYLGVNSELSLTSDRVTLECLTDSSQGSTEGLELWSIVGKPSTQAFHWNDRGSGTGGSLSTLNSYSLLDNLDFDDFTTTNTPDSWDIDFGAAGSNFFEDALNPYHGDSALKIRGDGLTGTLQISQSISASALNPLQRYCVAAYVKGEASTLAGTLTIQFEGTGYTAGSGEKIEMNAAALAAQTSFGLEYFFVNMPKDIPTDFELVIKVTGTLTSAKSVYIDRMCFGPVTWHNGIHFAIVAGAEPFLKGDRFTFDVTNDDAGVFQKFFRDAYGVQIPSDTGGTETIADSLAT